MPSPSSFDADDASRQLKQTGLFAAADPAVGSQVQAFRSAGFPTKTPPGLEFIARQTFLRRVCFSTPLNLTVN